jgi:hypothetical protein
MGKEKGLFVSVSLSFTLHDFGLEAVSLGEFSFCLAEFGVRQAKVIFRERAKRFAYAKPRVPGMQNYFQGNGIYFVFNCVCHLFLYTIDLSLPGKEFSDSLSGKQLQPGY